MHIDNALRGNRTIFLVNKRNTFQDLEFWLDIVPVLVLYSGARD